MKKITLCIIIFFAVVLAGLGSSFVISKRSAEEVKAMKSYAAEIGPLKGHLILLTGDKFAPCWRFSGEFVNLMTGSTFNVYVSLLGNVQTLP